MTVDVLTELTIARSVDTVSRYSSDPSNAPAWYKNIASIEWKTPPPARVGSQVAFVAQFLGRNLAYTYELVELIPGERLVMRTAQGPFPMETTYTWAELDPLSTLMTLRNRGEPSGFSKAVAPFIARHASCEPKGPRAAALHPGIRGLTELSHPARGEPHAYAPVVTDRPALPEVTT